MHKTRCPRGFPCCPFPGPVTRLGTWALGHAHIHLQGPASEVTAPPQRTSGAEQETVGRGGGACAFRAFLYVVGRDES